MSKPIEQMGRDELIREIFVLRTELRAKTAELEQYVRRIKTLEGRHQVAADILNGKGK